MGDGEKTYANGMELWDTVTNVITNVGHPAETPPAGSSLHKPVILTLDDDSILLIASAIRNNNEERSGSIPQMYKYTLSTDGGTWTEEGMIIPQNVAQEQYGVYRVNSIDNPNTFDILSKCTPVPKCDDTTTCNSPNGVCQSDGTCMCVDEFTGANCLSMLPLIFMICHEY